jgi:phosphotransacetylase
MTLEQARDLMRDVSYFGTMMVYKGQADGTVSGAAHTTLHTIRPALQFVNPNPTAEQLAEIAISSADTARTFGIEPRVAMLSYSSGESGIGEDVERVRQAAQLARERGPDLLQHRGHHRHPGPEHVDGIPGEVATDYLRCRLRSRALYPTSPKSTAPTAK